MLVAIMKHIIQFFVITLNSFRSVDDIFAW